MLLGFGLFLWVLMVHLYIWALGMTWFVALLIVWKESEWLG